MKKRKVFLSPTAVQQFELLCNYLIEEWSFKSKNDFIQRLDKKFDQISSQPESCPESEIVKGIRKASVDKRTSFLYRIHLQSIEVITIYDNRQSVVSIKKSIRKKN